MLKFKLGCYNLWDSCTEFAWERRPLPPCALRGFGFVLISYTSCFVCDDFDFVCLIMKYENGVVPWALWRDSNPSCLVQNFWESRALLNRSFCVLEKTPFLLTNSSIPLKSWSDSSIPSVDMFTRSLWSCLQILSSFRLDLILQSPSFSKGRGLKNLFLRSDRIHPITGWTDMFKHMHVGSTGE